MNQITVTGKIGPGEQLTAAVIKAANGVITFDGNGNVQINGQSIDISGATTVTCTVTAGTPPAFAFTIS